MIPTFFGRIDGQKAAFMSQSLFHQVNDSNVAEKLIKIIGCNVTIPFSSGQ